jgi:hypothetical protein
VGERSMILVVIYYQTIVDHRIDDGMDTLLFFIVNIVNIPAQLPHYFSDCQQITGIKFRQYPLSDIDCVIFVDVQDKIIFSVFHHHTELTTIDHYVYGFFYRPYTSLVVHFLGIIPTEFFD